MCRAQQIQARREASRCSDYGRDRDYSEIRRGIRPECKHWFIVVATHQVIVGEGSDRKEYYERRRCYKCGLEAVNTDKRTGLGLLPNGV